MASCVQCGISIPAGQRTCSMCYGDIDHGTDGYYRREMEEAMERGLKRRAEEERSWRTAAEEET